MVALAPLVLAHFLRVRHMPEEAARGQGWVQELAPFWNATTLPVEVSSGSPCTTLQRTCFSNALVPSEAARVRELLELFHAGMVASGGDYTLAHGTLLGLARTGSRIPWDDDLDTLLPSSVLEDPARPCGRGCRLTPSFALHRRALEERGLALTGFLGQTEAGGRPFFKVHFAQGHDGAIARTRWGSFPFIDVFIDVPYAPRGPCRSCWPTRRVAYDGITVNGPLPQNTEPALYHFFGVPAKELLRTCVDGCLSHCQAYTPNCGPCAPRSCSAAYAPYAPRAVRDSGSTVLAVVIGTTLVASLVSVAWVERERLLHARAGELAATLAVLLYVGSSIACDIFIQFMYQEGKGTFWPQTLVLITEFGKLCVSAVVVWASGVRCSSTALRGTVRSMALPALCFTYLNCMSFVALAAVHLGEYRVWRSTDILFTAALWVKLGGRDLRANQLAGILMVFAACVVLGCDDATHLDWRALVVVSLAAVASLGLVSNDLSFKADDTPFMIQNCALYALTSSMCAALVVGTVPHHAVLDGIQGLVLVYICVDMAMGLCVACVLKYANAIVKSMASAWLVPLELLLGHYFVGTPLTVYTASATMLAGVGNWYYRLDHKR